MTERSSGLDALLDLFVYAPVGLALLAGEELPKLAARGRAQLGGQLTMAKVVGQFAVAQGRRQFASRRPPGATPPRANLYVPTPSPGSMATAPGRPPPSPDPGDQEQPGGRGNGLPARPIASHGTIDAPPPAGGPAPASSQAAGSGEAADDAVSEASGLAIPGYDSLAASQVVPRLAGLSPEELAAVGAYESAHRARRTILNRVRQLQER
jgi:hypothetical protein